MTSQSTARLIILLRITTTYGDEMSALKYQLQDLVSSLSAEANKNKDPEVKKRFYLIKAVAESKKDVKKTCESRGVSTDLFYMWAKRFLNNKTLSSLKSKSKSALSFWNQTSKQVEKKIVRMRKNEPFKGPERISFDLKKKFKIICPPSTIAAILKRKGLVTKAYRDRLTKKHMRRYRRAFPGFLQMDFKYTPYLLEGKQTYQLSVVDHHSSWRFIRTYTNRRTETVIEFLTELLAATPFPIEQIQTDNAAEFTDKFSLHNQLGKPTECHDFDVWCKDNGIEHKLIPIGEKELNGKVENTHRFDDREFFSQINVTSYAELQLATREYNDIWNTKRPTKTLGWLTPNEVLLQAQVRAAAFILYHMPSAKPDRQVTIYRNNGTITASKSEIQRIKEEEKPKPRTKKPTAVDRYLQYLDWEDKNKINSALFVPMILQNFSDT
jgi:transposase InsO family protein